jgi:hypothetical protein
MALFSWNIRPFVQMIFREEEGAYSPHRGRHRF